MRNAIVAASLLGLSLVAGTASAGQSHYLVARALDQFTAANSVQLPDLTPFVEATHASGASGVDPVYVLNKSNVNSDTGHLEVRSFAGQAAGTNTLNPRNWQLAARLEQGATKGKPPPTGVRVVMVLTTQGSITTTEGMTVKLGATLVVDQCQIHVTRRLTAMGLGDAEVVDNCNARGAKASGSGSALIIDSDELYSSLSIEAQLDAEFTGPGAGYTGKHELSIQGDVIVTPRGGSFVYKSPTFGSKAAASPITPDGGAPPAGSDGGAGGPTNDDGGTNANVAPGGGSSDDSGCSVGAASPATSTGAGIAIALAAAAMIRRARRRGAAR